MQIEEKVNGCLVEPNDVEELTQKIQGIAIHINHYKPDNSTSKVISIQEHCKSLIRLYEEVTH